MIPVEEARARILAHARTMPEEWVGIWQAQGRVLARDLAARRTQPPFDVSAMDGYAVRAADTDPPGRPLRVIGEVPAGRTFEGRVGPGEAVRIFTGAPMPEGADAVLIQERARREGDLVIPEVAVRPGQFVRPAGLDFREGDPGLAAGTVLDGRSVGLLASMGHGFVPVRRRPRVALLATGDELVMPGETPKGAQIVSSNSVAVGLMARAWGAEVHDLGIARDDPGDLVRALEQARGVDVLVTSGGASVGSYDLVQEAAGRLGLELDFWKVAMRPGKPLVFGRLGESLLLGLPGNPVSAAVCAVVFLRSLLRAMLGLDPALPLRPAVLGTDLPENDEREDYLRGFVEGITPEGLPRVVPAPRQDSSMYRTFVLADVLIRRPRFDPPRRAGERVEVVELARVVAS